MIELFGIEIKIDVENVILEIEKNKNILRIKDFKDFSSQSYNFYNKDWKVKIFFGDKIKFIEGPDIYLYDFDYLYKKDLIFSRSEILYLGINLKEEKEIVLQQNKYYLLTPSNKIKIGKGKISSDLKEILISDEEKIIRNLLLITDGLLIRKYLKI